MGLFSKIPGIDWDYTRLKDAIDALTGEKIRRRAQHVMIFDAATGEPIVLNQNGTIAPANPQQLTTIADRLTAIFPTGVSTFDLPEQTPLTTSARALMSAPFLCRSVQVQSVMPNGTDNVGRIAIGTLARQTLYLDPGEVWGDSAPLGQSLDLSEIFVRALNPGDCITLVVRI